MIKYFLMIIASVGLVVTLFNSFAMEIFDFNAAVRTLVVNGTFDRRSFDEDGLPVYSSPRIGKYTSPFYIVHYGLEYSEACRAQVKNTSDYHWFPDASLKYWHSSPLDPSLKLFKTTADWIVDNTEYDENGNAHLYYHFDWPYENHPGGVLRGPWWSGLAEGHAIVLLMRAADCFAEERYMLAAEKFYNSILVNVKEGGSLLELNGKPWIEEYVDPAAPVDGLSRVFNGMVYAYFGVDAFERKVGGDGVAKLLYDSVVSNAEVFDLGYWSYYDAIGSQANIKYHNVNLALVQDPRIYDERLSALAERWGFGARFSTPFYLIYGPNGMAKAHYFILFIICVSFVFIILALLFRKVKQL